MLISKSKKFIYIHVDRTGGTTFSKAFKKYTIFQWSHRFHMLCLSIFGEIPSIHLLKEQTALSLRDKIGTETYNSYFKFAMIRNPWEWLVSDYSYRQQYKVATYHDIISKMTFEQYVKWKLLKKYDEIDPFNNNRGLSSWFTDESGNLLVDYVGRFENFSDEFQYFCQQIGVKATLPHLNQSKFNDYRKFYTDELAVLVEQYFKLDIETYGYKF
ncbi:sulfotransferase family 2 domain-containing protein [Fulvivirga sp.]|jgi:hypothetical protein|uniref:sulfotransferase family 2 domain-containing protein n=1 Tax=Fulvivirga sp. TaxID=1931237 RepID=UPI0032EBE947